MSYGGPGGIGFGVKPHAYDPFLDPEFFDDVPARRVIAFFIDVVVIAVPVMFAGMFVFLFGIVTLGLGWLLFPLLAPVTVIWSLVYYGMTLGGAASATLGMRAVDIEVRTWYGAPCHALLGAVHAAAFWVLLSSLTPLVLLVAFFNQRRRLLHDILLGTVVINNERRAAKLRRQGVVGTANRL
jgi:uncharacterized RDD family membrane protein YckC